jgi:hypothetical protein
VKLLAIAAGCVAALALSGCGGSQRDGVTVLPPERPRLDRPDSASMEECAWPIIVKVQSMTQQQVEALLGTNADRLIACFYKHRALVKFIRTRDDGLSGRAATGASN